MIPFIKTSLPCAHAFFTRKGGISQGAHASLNCGYAKGDDDHAVQHNRLLCHHQFERIHGLAHHATILRIGNQTHSDQAFWVDDQATPLPDACDALMTQNPHIILGVLTADCCPILIADPKTKTCAAIHAGWKGSLTGIIQNTLTLMQQNGIDPKTCHAVIGPSLHQPSFQVGQDFLEMYQKMGHSLTYIHEHKNTYYFDLVAFNTHVLHQGGIGIVKPSIYNTYAFSDLFFSYRRSTHQHTAFGVQLSTICPLGF